MAFVLYASTVWSLGEDIVWCPQSGSELLLCFQRGLSFVPSGSSSLSLCCWGVGVQYMQLNIHSSTCVHILYIVDFVFWAE